MGLYISNILDNYYNMRIEDRLTLIKKLVNLHEENKYDAGYTYDYGETLEAIKSIAYYTLKGQNFDKFYESLTSAQKKELQTQVYTASEKLKRSNWCDAHISKTTMKMLKDVYKSEEEYTKEEKELFVPDFKVLKEEFNNCDGLFHTGISSEKIISTFCRRYYDYLVDDLSDYGFTKEEQKIISKRYVIPGLSEFNNAIKDSISVIRDNINESTRNIFDSLDPTQQMYTMFTILSLSKYELNYWIEKRKEERENKLQGQRPKVVRINCKHGKITLMEDLSKYETTRTRRQQSKKRKAHTKMKEIRRVNSGYCY